MTVKCYDGFTNEGSETITCHSGIHYKFTDNVPRCTPNQLGRIISALVTLSTRFSLGCILFHNMQLLYFILLAPFQIIVWINDSIKK